MRPRSHTHSGHSKPFPDTSLTIQRLRGSSDLHCGDVQACESHTAGKEDFHSAGLRIRRGCPATSSHHLALRILVQAGLPGVSVRILHLQRE